MLWIRNDTSIFSCLLNTNLIIKARSSHVNYKIGDKIVFGIDTNMMHLFDKEEQNTIF